MHDCIYGQRIQAADDLHTENIHEDHDITQGHGHALQCEEAGEPELTRAFPTAIADIVYQSVRGAEQPVHSTAEFKSE